ncbi:MAG: hypothetical protein ACRCZ9_12825, partial [Fusobacteriaceae bacterium]
MIKRSINRLEPQKKKQMPLTLDESDYEQATKGLTLADMDAELQVSSFSQPLWLKVRFMGVSLPAPNEYLTSKPQRLRELLRLEIH